jgi:AcrR family transcriptional regulator
MGRWKPDAEARLKDAAIELFLERGFERTTVPEIATRAGLTTRTFFRYFADKREVLFVGEGDIADRVTEMMGAAAPDAKPLDLLSEGFRALSPLFEGQVDYLRRRRTVVDGDPGLRERELRKQAVLSERIADGFERRGLDALDALLIAEVASSVFRVGLHRWLDRPGASLADVFAETLGALTAVVGSRSV